MPKISVIVPIYNVESYLAKCLNSLVHQTMENIEIVLINDGSTDLSENIAKKYIKKHKNIKYYKKENGGQSSARNMGLKYANGEYIAFVDSDDYIELNMFEIMYEYALKNNLDIVMCGIKYVYDNYEEKVSLFNETRLITNKEYITSSPAPWNKIYRRELLKNANYEFPKGIIYEDLSLTPRLGIYTEKIGYVNNYLYNYIQRNNSTMNIEAYNPRINDIFVSLELLYNFFKENNKLIEFHDELECIFINHLLVVASQRFYKFNKFNELNKISDIMRDKFPKWHNNPCMKKFTIKERISMNLFYHKKSKIIKSLSKLRGKHEKN